MGDNMEFTFNSTKYIIILTMQLGQYDKMLVAQKKLLKHTASKKLNVSKNETSEAINAILDHINTDLQGKGNIQDQMYTEILGYLRNSDMRLWFNICLRLGKNLAEQTDKVSCERLDGMLSEMK